MHGQIGRYETISAENNYREVTILTILSKPVWSILINNQAPLIDNVGLGQRSIRNPKWRDRDLIGSSIKFTTISKQDRAG